MKPVSTQRTVNERSRAPLHDKDRLKTARINAGLSQAGLSRKAGLGRGTVSKLENGRGTRPETLGKIADALGCKLADLLFQPAGQANPETTP